MTNSSSGLSVYPPPDDHIRPGGWREEAACRNHPRLGPEFRDDSIPAEEGRTKPTANGHRQRQERIAAAVEVCRRCPVRLPCLDDVDLKWDEGVRGGVDLREWRKEKKGKAS